MLRDGGVNLPGSFQQGLLLLLDNNPDMDATQNYWDGLTEQDIEKLIYDINDDISIINEVKFLPMLDAPHPDTPTCGN